MTGLRALFAVASTALMLHFAGCGSNDGGDKNVTDAGADASKCTVDLECDDKNPCTLDSCGETKTCEFAIAPDGDAKQQVAGDCARTVCKKGLAQNVFDSGDVEDDGEQCTLDTCADGGGPQHVNKLNDSPCSIGNGNGSCQNGKCLVLCTPETAQTQCDDANPCTDDACLPCDPFECGGKGKCANQGLSGIVTPGAPQQDGDCHERRCVEGKDEDAIDNYDVPEDGNECTNDVCKTGIPVNEPVAAGEACSGSWVCDGDGKCVECLTAADCTGSSGPCYVNACTSGSCTQEYALEGTVLSASYQTPGDCKTVVCDGGGSYYGQSDATDLPDDGNACTDDKCVSGSPSHTYKPPGSACGTSGQVCNSYGNCCTPSTCAGKGLSCGTTSDDCGGMLDCGTCSSGDACSGGQCGCKNGYKSGNETDVDCGGICPTKCMNGMKCLAGSDCSSGQCVDGVCCNSACTGTCKACTSSKTGTATGTCANVTDGTDPDNECPTEAVSTCGTTGMCKSGACEFHPTGTVCMAASCSGNVLNKADTCSGSGACLDGGSVTCTAPYLCANGAYGTCSDGLKNGTETDVDCGGGGSCSSCPNGKKCTQANDCASGMCVDGYCCSSSCTGLCMACNLYPSYGTCTPIPNGYDPIDECAGPTKTCNGQGGCS